jgi:hypothetical protein
LGAAVVAIVFALFRGYFDHGKFEVTKMEWSSSGQLAIVARRSDHEALSGDAYFVLIGDHLFSPTELRRENYSHAVIFSTSRDCLTLRWEDSDNLVVTCGDSSIEPGSINVQQRRSGQVAISYVNIPNIR